MFSLNRQTAPPAAPVLDPRIAALQKQDAGRLKILMRERDDLQERIDAGLVESDLIVSDPKLRYRSRSERLLAGLDAEITAIQARTDQRVADALAEAERDERRRTRMPEEVAKLTADTKRVLAKIEEIAKAVEDLDAEAERIADIYGRRVATHVLQVPPVYALITGHLGLAQVFGAKDTALVHRWRHNAAAIGLTVPMATR